MSYRQDVSCPETLAKEWTKSAIDCYSIGCMCSKCFLYHVFFSKKNYECKMKYMVIKLVKNLGTPEFNS